MNDLAETRAAVLIPGSRWFVPLLIPLGLFVLFAIMPLLVRWSGQGFLLALVTRIMIFALAAMALDLLIGFCALISFGHAAYIGIGAYAVGILSSFGIDEVLIQLAVAVLAAGLFALVTGAISLRTTGAYFILITLAFGQMLYFLGSSLSVFGGDDGMSLTSRSQLFGHPVLGTGTSLYYAAFLVLAFFYTLCHALTRSRFGRVLRGLSENSLRMQAIGFSPFRYQLVAYVISGMIAAVAGMLLANQTEFISPAYASWPRSGELIFMVILGGAGRLYGAIAGAAAYTLLSAFLPGLTEHWHLIFGPLLILAVIFLRGGLTSLWKAGA